ncbi:MAG: tetratricopeptide repeat protein [Gemmatimonadetes bacterium]|nr:tetratricopeptide repeat protein [Gemmatimonadota bacterium]
MTAALEDPLRSARRAVHAGHFREAWESLDAQPLPIRQSPEWLLLSAMARWRLGDFSSSRSAALQARDGYRALGDVDGEMRTENVASAGAFALGELREAERGFARALALADRLSDELMLARCANNLGNVASYLARHTTALSFYRLAASRFEKVGFDYGVAETLINTGIVWRDLGNLEQSQDAAERALEIAERDETWRLAAQAFAMRGEAMALLGDLPLGRAQVERALALARKREDRLAEVEALRILCNLERRAGRVAESERMGRAALDLATTLAHPWSVAEVQRDLGELFAVTGRGSEAAACWTEAAAGFQKLGAHSRADEMRQRAAAVQGE